MPVVQIHSPRPFKFSVQSHDLCVVSGLRRYVDGVTFNRKVIMPYKNKEQQLEAQRNWYQKNKAAINAKHKQYRKENKTKLMQWFKEYKSTLCCMKCPENHPSCLHFHHRNPDEKRFTISTALRLCVCMEELLVEIAKCDVLCANCHAKEHH